MHYSSDNKIKNKKKFISKTRSHGNKWINFNPVLQHIK
jgi:hypothetical protein